MGRIKAKIIKSIIVTPAKITVIYYVIFPHSVYIILIIKNIKKKIAESSFWVDTYSTKYTCPFSSVSCSHPYGRSETQERLTGLHTAGVGELQPRSEADSMPFQPRPPKPIPPDQQLSLCHTRSCGSCRKPITLTGLHISSSCSEIKLCFILDHSSTLHSTLAFDENPTGSSNQREISLE